MIPVPEAEKGIIVRSIQALMNETIAAAEKADVEATFSHLSEDEGAMFFLGNRAFDRETLLSFFQEFYRDIALQEIRVSRSDVTVLAPDAALWTGFGVGRTVAKTGEETLYSFTETWVWGKSGDKWVVTHYHESAG